MTSRPGTPSRPLRAWQAQAMTTYRRNNPQDFLASATPGAGKTTFALALANALLVTRQVDRVIVVAPTDHLRTQWANEASAAGILLDPKLTNTGGAIKKGYLGYVTTYAQVAASPVVHRRRCELARTLVILDEIHHAGDGLSWGDATQEAFLPAARRLALTGTPFRTSPDERIPFVRYEEAGTDTLECAPDVSYSYRDALAEGVVRPVVFAAYAGRSKWMNSAGEVLSRSLSDADMSKEHERAAWRTALNPKGRWISHVFAAADARLTDLRKSGMPRAGGLILANDQESARAYADVLKKTTGHTPVVVVSDDPASSKRIAQFDKSDDRWLIAVRMVSEGVDVPRLGVLVWATTYRTPLFFAQAVGRVVRSTGVGESATVFLPAVRPLLALAADVEEQRNHVVRIAGDPAEGLDVIEFEPVRSEPGIDGTMTALEAEAEFAHVLSSGRAVTAPVALSPDDEDYLGLPGLLTPEQTAALLAARDVDLRRGQTGGLLAEGLTWADVDSLRKEVHRLAQRLAARTGRNPADVHVQARQAIPGPPTSVADHELLERRRDWLLSRLG